MRICLIAAMAANRVIGKDNKLPWHYPQDLVYFKKITSGHPVIMGRRTYESIGRPLPNRRNIVITSQKWYTPNVEVFSCIEECLALLQQQLGHDQKVFVIGGESLYKQFLEKDLVDEIYLTEIHKTYDGDRFFPFFEDKFQEVERLKTEELDFVVYRRKR